MMHLPRRGTWFMAAGLALALAMAGCGGSGVGGGGGGASTLVGVAQGDRLTAKFTTRVYMTTPESVADVYVSDLPAWVWLEGGDISDLSGSLVHIHLFVRPKAGRTPIAATACSASVRWLVVSGGEVGVYGGGGFATISGEPGKERVSLSLRGASLRLLHSTAGFRDALGPSTLETSLAAALDVQQAGAMRRAITALSAQANLVPDDQPYSVGGEGPQSPGE
ncbi:MAG: hypothetical protein KF859_04865 [Phycisphaeraceae bacterium]|nr:hypothetical protein [Phycisphaeraceae bacterium]